MSAINPPTFVHDSAIFDVYVKDVDGIATPDAGGALGSAGSNGFVFAPNLRFVSCAFGAWPKRGTARFDRVPLGGVIDGFELGLFDFGVDDQVRVVMIPGTRGTSIAPDPDAHAGEHTGIVVFEGTLQRAAHRARGASGDRGEDESVQLVATCAPAMDNLRPEHFINGRFYARNTTSEPWLIDGLSMPCVFNRDDKPNRNGGNLAEAEAGELSSVTADLFSADGVPGASYWSLKDALRHLVVCWLYGIKTSYGGDAQGALTRSATLEPETYDALFGPTPADDPRWTGLDKVLPEVDVQGLGVFDAVERVCRAGGYRCAVLPPMGRPMPEDSEVDRLFLLRIWRAGAGPQKSLLLPSRELVNDAADADEELAVNNLSRLSGLRDTARVRNVVTAAGRTLIETTVELKPMWSPDDVDNLGGGALGPLHQQKPVDQDGETYHQKHVAGGKQYEQYGHVGRLWGLDETGAFYSNGLGYTSGDYSHGAGGFDWLAHLGIDGMDDLTAARTANGVTDTIRWSRRPRKIMRLSRPAYVALDLRYQLEVSEDGGSNWHVLPPEVARPVDGFFGIELKIKNLALASSKLWGDNGQGAAAVNPAESWWSLFTTSTDLRFRITCLVEADHAARFDAGIDDGAWTRQPRAKRIDTRIVEVWQSPGSVIGDATWKRLDDGGLVASTSGADRTDNLQHLAERTRDEMGQQRLSIAAEHWLLDPTAFTIGDVVTGVGGRNLDFGLFNANSGETRYPSVVSVKITGHPERSQGLSFDIGDEAMRRGA